MSEYKLPKITDVKELSGKRVLLRSELNVPIENGEILNQFRLMRGLATINYLLSQNAKVILAGHIGREKKETLKPVFEVLSQNLDVRFTNDIAGADTKICVDEMKSGQVVMLENLRSDPRETKNDPEFARELASLADLYVNDAFSVSHREHASMVGIPKSLPSYVGLNFAHEYEELRKAMKPHHPSLFLLGGAKFATKMPLVSKYLEIYDRVFVGGALANDFFKALGFEVGTSLVSDIDLTNNPLLQDKKILLPVDVTVMGKEGVRTTGPKNVHKDEKILDAGPETISMLAPYIQEAQMVLWNGPFGDYEHGFNKATEDCARLIADAPGYSVVGGGDTIASIEALNTQEKYNFLSTAGGAMLAFLEHGTLPAIEALKDNPKK